MFESGGKRAGEVPQSVECNRLQKPVSSQRLRALGYYTARPELCQRDARETLRYRERQAQPLQ
jgi:hypothetical protein